MFQIDWPDFRERAQRRLTTADLRRIPDLIKIVFWDGTGLCLFTKRLENDVFLWPPSVEPGGTHSLTSAQLSLLIDGVD